jgi:putative acetyltransferase
MAEHGPLSLVVAIEPPDQPAVASLLDHSDAIAARLYPGAFRQPLNASTLSRPDITLFVARDTHGQALACAALLDLGDGTAELKRMIVDPDHAGQGVGRHLVTAILQSARARGYRSVLLEVGIRNVEARRLYESAGFRNRGPFGRYEQTPIATFMEITLEQGAG